MLSTTYHFLFDVEPALVCAHPDLDGLHCLAERLYQKGKLQQAEQLFLQALAHPELDVHTETKVSVLEHLGLIATRNKLYEDAVQYFELALQAIDQA
ncbi:hypothetical protein CBW65_20680 [Tumebacillus avium]|uniref:Tetratrico peptide repeat group 5 domain-containing protein n=1 Tax=Tumebacillus avium TaxID=1903704 RepID=A0A1Y0IUG1_9BACL|nr:tetratricopeptide repeat protein [Tumebacillus avium]ARU63125.1 hypothetical protein CBW65_20680 [Tumebacillus avium]